MATDLDTHKIIAEDLLFKSSGNVESLKITQLSKKNAQSQDKTARFCLFKANESLRLADRTCAQFQ
jgi:hypothetical protein